MDISIYGVVAEGPGTPYRLFTLDLNRDINLARLRVLVARRLNIDPNSWLAGQFKIYRLDEIITEDDERLKEAVEHPRKMFQMTLLPESLQMLSAYFPSIFAHSSHSGVHLLIDIDQPASGPNHAQDTYPQLHTDNFPPAYSALPFGSLPRGAHKAIAEASPPQHGGPAGAENTSQQQPQIYTATLAESQPSGASTSMAALDSYYSPSPSSSNQNATSPYMANPDLRRASNSAPKVVTTPGMQKPDNLETPYSISNVRAEDRTGDSYAGHSSSEKDQTARKRRKRNIILLALAIVIVLAIAIAVTAAKLVNNSKSNSPSNTGPLPSSVPSPAPAPAPAPADGLGEKYGTLPGIDYSGNDLVAGRVRDMDGCWSLCRSVPGCIAALSNGITECWAKSDLNTKPSLSAARVVLFPTFNTSYLQWTKLQQYDHAGDDIACYPNATPVAQCAGLCQIIPACKGVVEVLPNAAANKTTAAPVVSSGGCCLKTNVQGVAANILVNLWIRS
ncbi:hypothetical protein DFS34DRAFT_653373 [Phlyctochytrium arcticum]|nr:hypothetical protein DFS34DRAFT_653373 [Phlyctochytrium arcticum]